MSGLHKRIEAIIETLERNNAVDETTKTKEDHR